MYYLDIPLEWIKLRVYSVRHTNVIIAHFDNFLPNLVIDYGDVGCEHKFIYSARINECEKKTIFSVKIIGTNG